MSGVEPDQSDRPLVSVLMPVYNGGEMLRNAMDSILAQTFSDFEFVIVDDGSSDGTPEILASYDDPRLRVFRNKKNLGIVAALNRGLKEARGKYVARIDHDDLARPQRLEKQVGFLQEHTDYAAVSCWFILRRPDTPEVLVAWPETDVGIRWMLLFGTAMAHTGLVMRSSALQQAGPYDPKWQYVEDYDLECRLSRVGKLHNLPQVLAERRRLPEGLCGTHGEEQRELRLKLAEREWRLLVGEDLASRDAIALTWEVLAQGSVPAARDMRRALGCSVTVARSFVEHHDCAELLSRNLEWVFKEHVKLSLMALLRGRVGEAAARCWLALHLAGSGLVLKPLSVLGRRLERPELQTAREEWLGHDQ